MTDEDRTRWLGEVAWLLMQRPPHADWPLSAVGRAFLPPAALGQARLWRRGGRPVGVAVWAWLDAPREAAFLAGEWTPGPGDWRCGDRPVVTDMVAPFGGAAAMARDLLRVCLPGQRLRALRLDAEGRPRRVAAFAPARPMRAEVFSTLSYPVRPLTAARVAHV